MRFAVIANTKKWISMTPLIDVVFLLLIFFMLTTSFINQRGIKLQIPDPQGAKSSWQNVILIRPDKNGMVRINSEQISIEKLKSRLVPMLTASENKRVVVQPYREVELQTLVKALDVIRDSGAAAISLIK